MDYLSIFWFKNFLGSGINCDEY